MPNLEDAAASTNGAANKQNGVSKSRGSTNANGAAAPVYTPYQLPPLLQTGAGVVGGGGGPYSATTPSPSTAFPADLRFPPRPFSNAIPGHAALGAPAGDASMHHDQQNNHLDALMKLQAMGSRDFAGPSRGTGATGGSGGEDAAMSVEAGANGETEAPPRIVQKADRSCKKCRERRVRCGREFPSCARCKKRRDGCSYGEGVFVEESVEGSDQQRITDLENKIAALQQQLRSATSSAALPRPPSQPVSTPTSPPVALTRESLANEISRHVTEILSLPEMATLHNFIAEEDQKSRSGTFGSMDQRLASSGLADAVTCYLLDAANHACDSKHPGFYHLISRIPIYKSRLRNLDPPEQVAVAVLCALGARASPHHALFGVSTVHAEDGAPCPALFTATGNRREQVCKVLEHRARETAWATGIYRQRTQDALAAVVGLAQLSLHEENEPDDTRCFVRQAAGLFIDIRADELAEGAPSVLGKTLGSAIFLADAYLSSRCGKPTLISPNDLQDYYISAGFSVPDLVNLTISDYVEERGRRTFVPHEAAESIKTLMLYVMACYRVFAQVTAPSRRPDPATLIGFVRNLWNIIDQIHNAIQRFQQQLVSLPTPPAGSGLPYSPHDVDHAILLAVWADVSLVTLVGHVHTFIQQKREGRYPMVAGNDFVDLERTRSESFMRVFKCLKLLSFYCQLLCGSRDKHNVFHLLAQLSPLTGWTTLVSLRIGQPSGPTSEEFEVSEEEADWFRMALELSLFYSPRLSVQLRDLAYARQTYMHKPAPPVPPASLAAVFAPTEGSSKPPVVAEPAHAHDSSAMQQFATPSGLPTAAPQVAAFSLDMFEMNGQSGFADGAPDDLPGGAAGTANMRTAFRSIDWADLSLTPAVGSDGSNSSSDEWMKARG
ncbi:hypothetical protein JCM10908_005756 [Rhodotorula pacifica]|uniref:Zn(II)2Cys6 transcription factor domain-containing protein n=1 Tax=Rhodotorula pacifica TaxID=1495444 RepID=UPI00316E72D3